MEKDRRLETVDRRQKTEGWRVGGVAKKLKGEEKQNKTEKLKKSEKP